MTNKKKPIKSYPAFSAEFMFKTEKTTITKTVYLLN